MCFFLFFAGYLKYKLIDLMEVYSMSFFFNQNKFFFVLFQFLTTARSICTAARTLDCTKMTPNDWNESQEEDEEYSVQ